MPLCSKRSRIARIACDQPKALDSGDILSKYSICASERTIVSVDESSIVCSFENCEMAFGDMSPYKE